MHLVSLSGKRNLNNLVQRKKELKIFVVPKEGYMHVIGRKGSLTDEYNKEIAREDIKKWFDLAKIECSFNEDRNIGISNIKEEDLK